MAGCCFKKENKVTERDAWAAKVRSGAKPTAHDAAPERKNWRMRRIKGTKPRSPWLKEKAPSYY